MCERSGVPLSKKQECEEVCDGIALMPTEVSVRHLAGCLFEIYQECCERVGNHGTLRAQDAMFTNAFAGDEKMFFEVRGIAPLDLEKEHALIGT